MQTQDNWKNFMNRIAREAKKCWRINSPTFFSRYDYFMCSKEVIKSLG